MPKSRNSTLGAGGTGAVDEREMAQRMSDRSINPEPIRVNVNSTRGVEPLDVIFHGDGIADVMSGSGHIYQVDEAEESCTCPDYLQRGGRCQHMEGVGLARGMQDQTHDQGSQDTAGVDLPNVIHGQTSAEEGVERELMERNRHDDDFFYTEDPGAFREDYENARSASIPYEYENVLNGSNATFGIELEFVKGNSNAIARELYDMGLCGTRTMAHYHSGPQYLANGSWRKT